MTLIHKFAPMTQIKNKIENWIKETLKVDSNFAVEHPADLKNGDYSTNIAMALAKKENKNPAELANEFGRVLAENKIPEVAEVKVVGGFINFYLSKDFFAGVVNEINDKKAASAPLSGASASQEKILIDHTQPNPFKEFHIGHLMNNAIGESISRILATNGAEVKAVGYHGDVGLHVAKAIWGKMKNPELSWGEAYAYGAKNYDEHKEEITELNVKISDKSDPKINNLYEEGRKSSLNFFDSVYKRLDSRFDHHFYESETGEIGKKIVLENTPKIFEKSDGAVIFRGENFEPKTHTRVFINSNGIPVYEAKEIGLTKLKKDKYKFDKSITITASEQDSFFKVVEAAIGEIFPELKGKLKHLSHGMLRLPSGKMSSRTGDIIVGESLINQVKEKVFEKLEGRDYSKEEKDKISEIVAIGAIKYSILRQAIGGDIIFDFDKSISFEGDSGPYLQYTAVRANSVLEKAPKGNILQKIFGGKNQKRPENFEITDLEKYLYRYPEVVERAGNEYAPHHIVTYLTELAGIFNSFYAKEKIIDEDDPASPYKIAMTAATFAILRSGLNLLGIKVPDRM